MSALLPKADMCSALAYVCFVPIADIVNGDWHRWTKLFIALLIGLPPLPAVYPAHTLKVFWAFDRRVLGAVMGPQPNGWAALCLIAMFLPASSLRWVRCRSGTICADDRVRNRRCAVSTPLWSACFSQHSTIQCGRPGSRGLTISLWRS